MDFKKYNSIENHYRNKEISYWLEQFPELIKEDFVLEEKIHGANIQLIFQPNEKMKVGKRTSILNEKENFFDIWNTLEKYKEQFKKIQEYCDKEKCSLRLFGELFGQGVQKEIKYGEQQIRIFDCDLLKDGEQHSTRLTPYDLSQFMKNKIKIEGKQFYNFLVSYITGTLMKLEDALKFVVENKKSFYCDDNIEGVVIKPYNKVYQNKDGSFFMIKKKAEKFIEQKVKIKKVFSTDLIFLKNEFENYLTDNRLQQIFSHESPIESNKDIGKYIQLFIEDAKNDFNKDFSDKICNIEEKDLKYIYNAGSLPFEILKKYL